MNQLFSTCESLARASGFSEAEARYFRLRLLENLGFQEAEEAAGLSPGEGVMLEVGERWGKVVERLTDFWDTEARLWAAVQEERLLQELLHLVS